MRKSRHSSMIVVTVVLWATALASGCSGGGREASATNADPQCGSGRLTGAGATFQQNIQRRWINDFTTRCHAIDLSYDPVGSGAGIERFIEGSVDYAGSDTVMTTEEQQKADLRCANGTAGAGPAPRAIHLPVAGGAVVLLFNVPGVESLRLSPATAAGLLQGDIKMWNDQQITKDNPDVTLPTVPVVAVHRRDSSGTTDVLSNYMVATAGARWRLGTGKSLAWPGGLPAADGSDGVAETVAEQKGGITYAELSFAADYGLPTAALLNARGRYVKANAVNVPAALASAETQGSGPVTEHGEVRMNIDFAPPDPTAYPASTITYTIVCNYGNSSPDLLRSYLAYVLTRGQETASTIGYAPLPDLVATKARRAAVALG